jgi:hypothetical protein
MTELELALQLPRRVSKTPRDIVVCLVVEIANRQGARGNSTETIAFDTPLTVPKGLSVGLVWQFAICNWKFQFFCYLGHSCTLKS